MAPVSRRDSRRVREGTPILPLSLSFQPMMSLGKFIWTADGRKTIKAGGVKYGLVGGHVGSKDKFFNDASYMTENKCICLVCRVAAVLRKYIWSVQYRGERDLMLTAKSLVAAETSSSPPRVTSASGSSGFKCCRDTTRHRCRTPETDGPRVDALLELFCSTGGACHTIMIES